MSELKVPSGAPQPQGIGEDPLLAVTRLFVRFLQAVFATFEKGSYRWCPDQELTDIIISDQGILSQLKAEMRPAIVCQRGPASWANLALDQFKKFDFEQGKRTHTDLMNCTMVYNCLAREGLEAQRIAWAAGYATRTLKRHLLRAALHRVGENIDFSAETSAEEFLPDSGTSTRLVQVYVPFFFQQTWSMSPVDNLLLKELDLRLTSQLTGPVPDEPPIRPPALGGRVLRIERVYSLTQRVSSVPGPKK